VRVRRQVKRLQRAAALVTADLARSLGREWRCEVDDQYVLTVVGREREERAALANEIEDVDWFLPEGAEEEKQASTPMLRRSCRARSSRSSDCSESHGQSVQSMATQ
jgi:hypothetical protein